MAKFKLSTNDRLAIQDVMYNDIENRNGKDLQDMLKVLDKLTLRVQRVIILREYHAETQSAFISKEPVAEVTGPEPSDGFDAPAPSSGGRRDRNTARK